MICFYPFCYEYPILSSTVENFCQQLESKKAIKCQFVHYMQFHDLVSCTYAAYDNPSTEKKNWEMPCLETGENY